MKTIENARVSLSFREVGRDSFYKRVGNISRTETIGEPAGYEAFSFYDKKNELVGLLLTGRAKNKKWVKRYFINKEV